MHAYVGLNAEPCFSNLGKMNGLLNPTYVLFKTITQQPPHHPTHTSWMWSDFSFQGYFDFTLSSSACKKSIGIPIKAQASSWQWQCAMSISIRLTNSSLVWSLAKMLIERRLELIKRHVYQVRIFVPEKTTYFEAKYPAIWYMCETHGNYWS